jgi:hypothetical protein
MPAAGANGTKRCHSPLVKRIAPPTMVANAREKASAMLLSLMRSVLASLSSLATSGLDCFQALQSAALPNSCLQPPAALAAKKRGGSFDCAAAAVAMAQGYGPDTHSSEVHLFNGNRPAMPFMHKVMSKFLHREFSLSEVFAMCTQTQADLALVDLAQGPMEFVNMRSGKAASGQKGTWKPWRVGCIEMVSWAN